MSDVRGDRLIIKSRSRFSVGTVVTWRTVLVVLIATFLVTLPVVRLGNGLHVLRLVELGALLRWNGVQRGVDKTIEHGLTLCLSHCFGPCDDDFRLAISVHQRADQYARGRRSHARTTQLLLRQFAFLRRVHDHDHRVLRCNPDRLLHFFPKPLNLIHARVVSAY